MGRRIVFVIAWLVALLSGSFIVALEAFRIYGRESRHYEITYSAELVAWLPAALAAGLLVMLSLRLTRRKRPASEARKKVG